MARFIDIFGDEDEFWKAVSIASLKRSWSSEDNIWDFFHQVID